MSRQDEIKRMYSLFPYPSPAVGENLISDLSHAVAFLLPDTDLTGWRILDAGCGTGQRIIQLAKQNPGAELLGIDMTRRSLMVARDLAVANHVANIRFEEHDILNLDLGREFDLIVSTGLLHHLDNPFKGFQNVYRHLKPNGIFMLWLYHRLGEFDRLLRREAIYLLVENAEDPIQDGKNVLEELRWKLPAEQYGTEAAAQVDRAVYQLSIDIDAFVHPIVETYRFSEIFEWMSAAEADWYAPYGVNARGKSWLIDLNERGDDAFFSVPVAAELKSGALMERYRRLHPVSKLKLIECLFRPTGLTVVCGRGDSFTACDARVAGNLMG
jgi:SAM-dependent methyltransferase